MLIQEELSVKSLLFVATLYTLPDYPVHPARAASTPWSATLYRVVLAGRDFCVSLSGLNT